MYSTQSPADRLRTFLKSSGVLSKLLLINVLVWFLVNFGSVIAFLFREPGKDTETIWLTFITNWLALPAQISGFASRPWTIISYMFLHLDFWHLLFNMLWLYWFGKIFLEFLTNRQLLASYLFGGLAGGLVYMAAFNIFPVFAQSLPQAVAIGASASVLSVVIMISFTVPDYVINLLLIGKVKIKYIAIFMVITDLLMIRSGNAGGHFAHLGGALWGIAYVLLLRNRLDPSLIFDVFNRSSSAGRRKKNPKTVKFRKVHQSAKPLTDEEYNARKAHDQQRIDEILDKIAKSGYTTLSKEEKEFLFKSSKK